MYKSTSQVDVFLSSSCGSSSRIGGSKAAGGEPDLSQGADPKNPASAIMKSLGIPDMLRDALPSTIAQKMTNLTSIIRKKVGFRQPRLSVLYFTWIPWQHSILRSCLEKRITKMADLHKKYQESGSHFTEIQTRLLRSQF